METGIHTPSSRQKNFFVEYTTFDIGSLPE